MQLKILWEEMLARDLEIEIAGPPVRLYSNFIRGIRSLPVRIPPDRRDARGEGLLQQPDVARDRDEVVAELHELGGLPGIDGEPAGRLSVLLRRRDRGLLGLREAASSKAPGLSSATDRSLWPSHSMSTPGSAAISSAASAPRGSSICRMIAVRSFCSAKRGAGARCASRSVRGRGRAPRHACRRASTSPRRAPPWPAPPKRRSAP